MVSSTKMIGYTDANESVEWAASRGIVLGYEDQTFRPDLPVTREQIAVILCWNSGSPEADGSLAGYTDASTVSSYADEAMRWAVAQGLISGTTDTTLSPGESANRAQTAVMLMRYLQK